MKSYLAKSSNSGSQTETCVLCDDKRLRVELQYSVVRESETE